MSSTHAPRLAAIQRTRAFFRLSRDLVSERGMEFMGTMGHP